MIFGNILSMVAQRCVVCLSWAGVDSVDARHWVQQSHVLGAVERQTLGAVMVHHLWDAGENTAALVQGVAVFFSLGDNDMNAALARPESHRGEERQLILPTIQCFVSA